MKPKKQLIGPARTQMYRHIVARYYSRPRDYIKSKVVYPITQKVSRNRFLKSQFCWLVEGKQERRRRGFL